MNAPRWVIDFDGALAFEFSDGLTVFIAAIGNHFPGLTNPWGDLFQHRPQELMIVGLVADGGSHN